MKVTIPQEELAKILTVASRFTTAKAQLPVLGNIYLSAEKNHLSVSATNLETAVSITKGVKVEKEGDITVPAKIISDLISNLKKVKVEIVSEKEQLQIKSEDFSSTISGMNASDFPDVAQDVNPKHIVMDGEKIKDALSKVLFSTSSDETRPVLTGVLVITDDTTMSFVSTDGFRLSEKKIDIKKQVQEGKVIIPKSALSEVVRMVGEDEKIKISIAKKDSQVIFGIGSTILSSRLIEGEFPDFKKIIPETHSVLVNVDKSEFLRAVKLASVFARDSANVIKMKLAKKEIEISAESAQSGKQKTLVPASIERDGSEDFEIAYNYKFVEDFLNAAEGESIDIKLNDPNSPSVFLDTKDKDFLHLIMPVKI